MASQSDRPEQGNRKPWFVKDGAFHYSPATWQGWLVSLAGGVLVITVCVAASYVF